MQELPTFQVVGLNESYCDCAAKYCEQGHIEAIESSCVMTQEM